MGMGPQFSQGRLKAPRPAILSTLNFPTIASQDKRYEFFSSLQLFSCRSEKIEDVEALSKRVCRRRRDGVSIHMYHDLEHAE